MSEVPPGASNRPQTAQGRDSAPLRRPISAARAPRSPRPGPSRLIASSRLVLPTPFSPAMAMIRPAKCASKLG
jgi:hypothetical protein